MKITVIVWVMLLLNALSWGALFKLAKSANELSGNVKDEVKKEKFKDDQRTEAPSSDQSDQRT